MPRPTNSHSWRLFRFPEAVIRSCRFGGGYPGNPQGIHTLPYDDDGSAKLYGIVKDRFKRAKRQKIKADMCAATSAEVRDPAEGQDAKNKAAALVASYMLMATTFLHDEVTYHGSAAGDGDHDRPANISYGFEPLPSNGLRLLLPMTTVLMLVTGSCNEPAAGV